MAIFDIGTLNAADFTINGRNKDIDDVQRTFMWQVFIPRIRGRNPLQTIMDDMLVRCRTVSIPQRSNEAITSNFMGTRQFFPGKADPGGGTVTIGFEETERMPVARMLYGWQQHIFDIKPGSVTSGKSHRTFKKDLISDIYLIMIGYGGIPLKRFIVFHNAWIQNVGEVSLGYDTGEAVKYEATFQYDYWTLEPDIDII